MVRSKVSGRREGRSREMEESEWEGALEIQVVDACKDHFTVTQTQYRVEVSAKPLLTKPFLLTRKWNVL